MAKKEHAKMNFPESLIENFIFINSLDQEKLESILNKFNESDLSLDCSSFSEDLCEKFSVKENLLHDLYHFLITMIRNLNRVEKSNIDFLEQMNQFVIENSKDNKKYNSAKIIDFIHKAASNSNIKILSKSSEIIRTNSKNYISNSAKIITDIRPILIDENDSNFVKELKYATIIHNFKLMYNKGGERKDLKEFYLTLNSEDLYELRDVINRAIEKDTFFKDFLVEKEINYID